MYVIQNFKQRSIARKTAILLAALTLSTAVATNALAAGHGGGGGAGSGLVVMPWRYDPGADYVFMNVGLGPQLAVCDEVANPSFWTARNFTKYLAENGHCNSPEQLFSVFPT